MPHKVELSDGSSLLVSPEYLPDGITDPSLWEGGRVFNPQEEEAFRFADACYRAEKIALKLVARAEQNCLGLQVKLERRGFDAAVAQEVVSGFQTRKFVDDGRYAELWLRSRLSSGKSPRWLFISLGKKGIKRETSLKTLEKLLDPETEFALLLMYIKKAGTKNTKISKSDSKNYFKSQLRHEGFSIEVLDRYFTD